VTLNLLGHLSNSNDLTGGTPYAELKVNGTQRGIWGMVLAYLGVEDREALRMQCKTTAKLEQEQNWLPQWVAVYLTVGNARALRWMQRHRPPHVKRSLSGRGPGGVPAVPRAAPTAALRYAARRGGARDRVSSGARFASCPGSPRGRRLSRTALGGRRVGRAAHQDARGVRGVRSGGPRLGGRFGGGDDHWSTFILPVHQPGLNNPSCRTGDHRRVRVPRVHQPWLAGPSGFVGDHRKLCIPRVPQPRRADVSGIVEDHRKLCILVLHQPRLAGPPGFVEDHRRGCIPRVPQPRRAVLWGFVEDHRRFSILWVPQPRPADSSGFAGVPRIGRIRYLFKTPSDTTPDVSLRPE